MARCKFPHIDKSGGILSTFICLMIIEASFDPKILPFSG